MWLRITNQPSQILHDGAILGYTDFIIGQYIFRLKETLKSRVFVNSADIKPIKAARPEDIKLWYLHMGHLSYKSLTVLKNLSDRMNFKATTLSKLCRDYQKRDQTRQSSRSPMSKNTEFLTQVYSDLKRLFPQRR